jgi:heat shock protein HtpX
MGSYARTTLLLAALSGVLLLIGQALGGQSGMIVAFGFAVVMNFGSYWFSDRIVLRMYRAAEVGPDHPLARVVQKLALKGKLPMPKVFVIPTQSPNAFATGRNPAHASVAATEGLLHLLSADEIEGVMAHEMAHVAHRDILIQSVAATIGAAIMMLANMARWAAIFGIGGRGDDRRGSPVALIATALIAPLAAMIIQAAISRSREFAADEGGAKLAGRPDGLASALRRIEAAVVRAPLAANPATAHLFIRAPFSTLGGVGALFSTHPPTDERVERLMRLR